MVRAIFHSPNTLLRPAAPAVGITLAPLLLVALIGCSVNRGPSEVTTIVFDGQKQTFDGTVTCTTQADGKLVILALGDDQKTVRVLLRRERHVVVEKVGLHVPDANGFVDDSNELWATEVDDIYTINGRMPPNAGETASHQFQVDVTCRREVPIPYSPPHSPYLP